MSFSKSSGKKQAPTIGKLDLYLLPQRGEAAISNGSWRYRCHGKPEGAAPCAVMNAARVKLAHDTYVAVVNPNQGSFLPSRRRMKKKTTQNNTTESKHLSDTRQELDEAVFALLTV